MDHTRDIDDILREVEAEFSTGAPQHNGDLEALTAAWIAERSAPELLEYILSTSFQEGISNNFTVGHKTD